MSLFSEDREALQAENERLRLALNNKGSLNPFSYIAELAATNPYVIWSTGTAHCHFCLNVPALPHEPDCLWARAARLAGELHLSAGKPE